MTPRTAPLEFSVQLTGSSTEKSPLPRKSLYTLGEEPMSSLSFMSCWPPSQKGRFNSQHTATESFCSHSYPTHTQSPVSLQGDHNSFLSVWWKTKAWVLLSFASHWLTCEMAAVPQNPGMIISNMSCLSCAKHYYIS